MPATMARLSLVLLLAACSAPQDTSSHHSSTRSLTCSNGTIDDTESDVDCGGSCLKCIAGRHCRADADCQTAWCSEGICAPDQPSCDDQHKNGRETDVDCGGPCGGCATGQACAVSADCRSESCVEHVCDASATCHDAQLTPGE